MTLVRKYLFMVCEGIKCLLGFLDKYVQTASESLTLFSLAPRFLPLLDGASAVCENDVTDELVG